MKKTLLGPLVLGLSLSSSAVGADARPGAAPPGMSPPALAGKAGFRVRWEGKFVVGITSVSGFTRRTAAIEGSESGGRTVHMPGKTVIQPIVLRRPHTGDTDFEQWANLLTPGSGATTLARYRKDLIVDLHNEAGQKTLSFRATQCWPIEYQPVGELDAEHAVAVETLVLQCDGIDRDTSVPFPAR